MTDLFAARRSRLSAFALLALWTSVLFWFNATRVQPRRQLHQCLSNLKQIGIAMAQYTEEHDDTFPPAANWMTALKPHLPPGFEFQCPARPDLKWGYAINPRLAGLNWNRLKTSDIAVVFDSDTNVKNAVDWRASVLPRTRHSYGVTILFADGHVYGNHNDSNFTRGILPPKTKKSR